MPNTAISQQEFFFSMTIAGSQAVTIYAQIHSTPTCIFCSGGAVLSLHQGERCNPIHTHTHTHSHTHTITHTHTHTLPYTHNHTHTQSHTHTLTLTHTHTHTHHYRSPLGIRKIPARARRKPWVCVALLSQRENALRIKKSAQREKQGSIRVRRASCPAPPLIPTPGQGQVPPPATEAEYTADPASALPVIVRTPSIIPQRTFEQRERRASTSQGGWPEPSCQRPPTAAYAGISKELSARPPSEDQGKPEVPSELQPEAD